MASKQEYEKAAMLRDKKNSIERISEKQKVSNINEKTIDVIGFSYNELYICIELFFVRNSKMVGREHYFFDNTDDIKNILTQFVKQYYINKLDIPNKIMLPIEIEDILVLEQLLSNKTQKKVEIKIPKKGEKLRFIEMADNNAKITLDNKSKEKEDIVLNLKQALKLETLPRKIECFDISNIAGEYMVAGMCVAKDGVINKNLARKFKIKTVLTQDDPKCLEEVVTRRLKHSIENSKGAFGTLPDLILADGGITQIRAIKRAIESYKLTIPVYGMVKDNKHNTKCLINDERKEVKLDDNLINFITRMQDEVHRIAIEYNRKLRNNDITKSKLDNIKGIGEKKKAELIKKFGSIQGIKKVDVEEISAIKGINKDLARIIKEKLDE